METAITLINPPELTLAEDRKVELSALVQAKLEETSTLTLVSTDEQFETAGEQLKAIAQLRHEMRAVHVASPRILRTAASKVCHSAICDFSACAPLLVSL